MDLIQVIGFLVTLFFMVVLSFRRKHEKQNAHYPESFEDEHKQKQNLKTFLKSLQNDMEDEEDEDKSTHQVQKWPQLPPPPVSLSKAIKPSIEDRNYRNQDKAEPYRLKTVRPTSLSDRYKKDEKPSQLDNLSSSSAYHTFITHNPSRGRKMINKLSSRQEMIVYQEILNPPVSLRSHPY